MEKGELENPELAESLFSPVSPEDGAEAVLPPDVPPPFTNEVLERVMAAAEQDLPQERENELRHEKKGEAVVPLAAMAVSVGQVLAEADNSFFPKSLTHSPRPTKTTGSGFFTVFRTKTVPSRYAFSPKTVKNSLSAAVLSENWGNGSGSKLQSVTDNKRNGFPPRSNYVPLSRRELYKRAMFLGFLSGLCVLAIFGVVIIIR